MSDDNVSKNLKGMDELDFIGWNGADWQGVFAHYHTDDVYVDWKGQEPTRGIQQHIDTMKAFVDSAGGTPPRIVSHPIGFGGPVSSASSKMVAAWSLPGRVTLAQSSFVLQTGICSRMSLVWNWLSCSLWLAWERRRTAQRCVAN